MSYVILGAICLLVGGTAGWLGKSKYGAKADSSLAAVEKAAADVAAAVKK